MTSGPDSTEPSPPDPPGPTSDQPEPPRQGPQHAPGGALTASGAWAFIRKTIF